MFYGVVKLIGLGENAPTIEVLLSFPSHHQDVIPFKNISLKVSEADRMIYQCCRLERTQKIYCAAVVVVVWRP